MIDSHQNTWEKYPAALPKDTILAGRYIIQDVLGQGGFGITYLAEDYQSKNNVAIKEFFPESMVMRQPLGLDIRTYTDERSEYFRFGMQSFIEEAKLLAQLRGHPNIVTVHRYFEENNTAYFVMDYIKGTVFKTYIKEHGGKLSWEDTWKIMQPVMDALQAAHQKGIIHRDVAPDNIIIMDDNTVKLIDFGAARYSLGERSQSLDVILKPGYTPKEQYLRHGKQGPYTDVYSVAACFYAALSGYIPPESLDRIDKDTLISLSSRGVELPAAAEQAILQGLNVQPEKRFLSMESFQTAIQLPPPVPPKPKWKLFPIISVCAVFILFITGIRIFSGRIMVVDNMQDTTYKNDETAAESYSEAPRDETVTTKNGEEIQTPTLTEDKHLPESLSADEEEKLYYMNMARAELDVLCKDDPTMYVLMGCGTVNEAHQTYENFLNNMLIDLLSEEIYDQYGDTYRECLQQALAKADYTVTGAEKQGEKYVIMVQYKQLQFFEAAEEEYRAGNRALIQEWLEKPESIPDNEEDMIVDVLTRLYSGMIDALEIAQYGKKVYTMVDLKSNGEGIPLSLFIKEELFDMGKIKPYAERRDNGSLKVRGYDDMHYFRVWDDGDAYLGGWNKDGQVNGDGIYVWSNGNIYAGNFKAGKRNGYGVNIYTNGTKYDGNWKNDQKID